MDSRRLILIFALFAMIYMLWMAWVREHPLETPAPAPTPSGAPASAPAADVPAAPAGPSQAAAQPEPEQIPSGERIHVETDLMRVEIDTQGGDIRRLYLLSYPVSSDTPDQPYELLTDSGDEVFAPQTGLIGRERTLPNHRTLYQATKTSYRLADGEDSVSVPLQWTAPDGTRYTKTYTFLRNRYVIDVSFTVDNSGGSPWNGYLYAQFQRSHVAPHRTMFMAPASYVGGAIYTPDEKFKKYSFDDMAKTDVHRDFTDGWVAMLQHYFVGAWLPSPNGHYQAYSRKTENGRYNFGYKTTQALELAPGQQGSLDTRLYVGPKAHARLSASKVDGLVLTVDYGWLTPISAPLFWVLKTIHHWVGNWGWAIILLTVLIKLAFYPLSAASYKSMAKMRKVTPRMQSLKERYADDKQKLQQAMMELYKEEKINPMGGCLPMVIQIPVFIALYWVLLESVELRQAPFALWIHDLSSPDPYFVLPILMGVSMVVQQLLSPTALDPMQKKLMMALPVVFTGFFLFFPAGLVLYWLVNNVLSITQQWRITHVIEKKGG
jgi:YidC/Oxa1 family membrane protein insertase